MTSAGCSSFSNSRCNCISRMKSASVTLAVLAPSSCSILDNKLEMSSLRLFGSALSSTAPFLFFELRFARFGCIPKKVGAPFGSAPSNSLLFQTYQRSSVVPSRSYANRLKTRKRFRRNFCYRSFPRSLSRSITLFCSTCIMPPIDPFRHLPQDDIRSHHGHSCHACHG